MGRLNVGSVQCVCSSAISECTVLWCCFSPEYSERLARELWKGVDVDNVETVRLLLGQGADPDHQLYWSWEWTSPFNNSHKDPPLHTACRKGNVSIVKMLIEAGADVDKCNCMLDYTPLHHACSGGHKEVVDYLIREAGCKVGELYLQQIH